jgi:hypothetical protein
MLARTRRRLLHPSRRASQGARAKWICETARLVASSSGSAPPVGSPWPPRDPSRHWIHSRQQLPRGVFFVLCALAAAPSWSLLRPCSSSIKRRLPIIHLFFLGRRTVGSRIDEVEDCITSGDGCSRPMEKVEAILVPRDIERHRAGTWAGLGYSRGKGWISGGHRGKRWESHTERRLASERVSATVGRGN